MSYHSDLDLILQEVNAAMSEPTEADLREMSISQLERELRECPVKDLLDIILTGVSEVCARATMSEEVAAHEVQVGRILTRVQLVASMLESRKQPRFRIVQ